MVSTITPALVELLAKTLNSLKTNTYVYYLILNIVWVHAQTIFLELPPPFLSLLPSTTYNFNSKKTRYTNKTN